MYTPSVNAQELARRWYIVDASGVPLGRLASQVAFVLRGKHRPEYTPHVDSGDFVIVINAARVKLTGTKPETKFYYRHSGFPGGFRAEPYRQLLVRRPSFVIEKAVKGMLPKNRLGRKLFRKLKVYREALHPHGSQKPEPLKIGA